MKRYLLAVHRLERIIRDAIKAEGCKEIGGGLAGALGAVGIDSLVKEKKAIKLRIAFLYPQWMAFAKYSYKQLRWAVIQKPAMREAYVEGILHSELKVITEETDALFEEFCVGRFVVFE